MYNIINPSSGISNINVNSKRNLKIVYNGTKLNTADPGGYGLIWKKDTVGLPSKVQIQEVKTSNFKYQPNTLAALGGQKIYLLSHDSTHPSGGKINLQDTIYGIPQDKFIGDNKSIESLSFSSVRGEKMIELIRKIFAFVKGHVHAIATMPPIPVTEGNGASTVEIDQILADAENTILNQNIRLN